VIELAQSIPIDMNYWQSQNIYYRIMKRAYGDFALRAAAGDEAAAAWVRSFTHLGEILSFNVAAVAPGG
jgi:hypothetical protein